MHAMAKTAGKGLEKVSTVARRGMTHVGRGLSRVGLRTQRFGRKLAGVGVAAARGLARVGQSYRRNAIQARTSLGHRIYAAGEGISRVGDAVSRGYKMQQEGKEKISEEFSYMLIAWSLLEKTRASHYSTQSGRRTRHRVGHYG